MFSFPRLKHLVDESMLIVQTIDSAIDFLEVKAFKVDGHELLEFSRDYHIAQNGVIA